MANIKLKNASGVETTYNGVTTIKVPLASGSGNQDFIIPTLQSKTATTNGTITADSGYDGLSSVTVSIPVYDGSVE